ncbi:uncharacterized protein LOC133721139 [Rosa rugosa]|uniref:uncharacterized protein LOC133721139 n=1 Tax=Rosa rugosa TaxID=74645 RepID=UPI002B40C31F|nr:uncharacterized protein LOC133721139 [Rosa rugosa]XP_062003659.1 uncharacterized protein LOC133721139 [Rosa rugosa]
MAEVRGSNSFRDEMASLLGDAGIRYAAADPIGISTASFAAPTAGHVSGYSPEQSESLKDQVKGFAMAWGEILLDLGRGCKDIVQQSFLTEDSYIVRKLETPCAKASAKLRYLNEFLPEDRDPAHAWLVILFVFILALTAISINTEHDSLVRQVKRVQMHRPSATHVLLPDGRRLAYHEQGVPAKTTRISLIAPHSFLSSRLAGMPGIKISLLEEFGIRLITYDLPGFGESDPHPSRNLNSSAIDILCLANAIGIEDKFWVLGHSSGAMHAWAALRYIPDKVAGAAMVAPIINPYEPGMTKEEMKRTWEPWVFRRKTMYFFARRFPKFLNSYYRRSFLSGKHDRIDKWLSLSLGKRDEILIEEPKIEEHLQRDVEESIRQDSTKPFIEEAVLQVSKWGFSVADLQVQKKCQQRGILTWLRSFYSEAECELTGFLGQIHIWQGMDDQIIPPSVTDYISRVLPGAYVHKLPNEGHFSYLYFCDECHRQMFTTLFGSPQGPVKEVVTPTQVEGNSEELSSSNADSPTE